MDMEHKRLTLFAGHYGSGKTNIAVNYAVLLAKEGKKVCIADLDIVNPYFRTKDSEKELEENGIKAVFSTNRRALAFKDARQNCKADLFETAKAIASVLTIK